MTHSDSFFSTESCVLSSKMEENKKDPCFSNRRMGISPSLQTSHETVLTKAALTETIGLGASHPSEVTVLKQTNKPKKNIV